MSEYWVSKKKYFCKYCQVFIADDAPSRTHHESGLRHQGNKERFIRNLYKTSEKTKQDADEEAREMARIDQAAKAAFAADVHAGHAKQTPSTSGSLLPAPKTAKPKPTNLFANYTSAKDLGIADDEEAKAAAALELQQSEGRVGQWEVVQETPAATATVINSTSRKRAREENDPDDEDNAQNFKVRQRKNVTHGLGQIYDPGKIVIKPKTTTVVTTTEITASAPAEASNDGPKPILWKKTGWSAVQADTSTEDSQASALESIIAANEKPVEVVKPDPEVEEKPATTEPVDAAVTQSEPKAMFKKKKVKVSKDNTRTVR